MPSDGEDETFFWALWVVGVSGFVAGVVLATCVYALRALAGA